MFEDSDRRKAEGGSVKSNSDGEPQADDADHNGGSAAEREIRGHVGSRGVENDSAGGVGRESGASGAAPGSKSQKPRKGSLKARVGELESALEKAEQEAAENYDRWLRARAEYDNLRKRTRREIEAVHLRAGEDLIRRLLPVLDNLEKAIDASRNSPELSPMEEGLLLIHKGLMEPLRESGVEDIDPLGEKFDPNFHEALMQMRTEEAEPGTVVQVLQKGYSMNGVTLRPAKVAVAGPDDDSAADGPGGKARGSGEGEAGRSGSSGEERGAGRSAAGEAAGEPGDEERAG